MRLTISSLTRVSSVGYCHCKLTMLYKHHQCPANTSGSWSSGGTHGGPVTGMLCPFLGSRSYSMCGEPIEYVPCFLLSLPHAWCTLPCRPRHWCCCCEGPCASRTLELMLDHDRAFPPRPGDLHGAPPSTGLITLSMSSLRSPLCWAAAPRSSSRQQPPDVLTPRVTGSQRHCG